MKALTTENDSFLINDRINIISPAGGKTNVYDAVIKRTDPIMIVYYIDTDDWEAEVPMWRIRKYSEGVNECDR